ncbi:hypothetical protein FBY30_2141 [Arthrobacter sp. SLBN-83]|uniref:hypothetical protein n=1 Tax=Arthrobacter sp. SLBN-83 TaxID=2768449 RepID=UPI001151444D|nr:hypothetical protein [Arthrobacter sp. SLBN-83]TQJ59884.1 hypothetical protein FBY30_2141 [Arthrobacter sp. SLBN-83]
MGDEPEDERGERIAAWLAGGERFDKVFGSWASAVAALLVMAPSVYRFFNGPVQWYDVVSVIVGAGLINFHAVRVVRLRCAAAHVPARRANS